MKENPFNWVRIIGYLLFLVGFGGFFENLHQQSGLYWICLSIATFAATKIIILMEEILLADNNDPPA